MQTKRSILMITGCAFMLFWDSVLLCRGAESIGVLHQCPTTDWYDDLSFVQVAMASPSKDEHPLTVRHYAHEHHRKRDSWKWAPADSHWRWGPPYTGVSRARLGDTQMHEWILFGVGMIVFGAIQQYLYVSQTPIAGLVVWLGLGGAFTCCILWVLGRERGEAWLTGYIIELFFSLDNCFVSVIIARFLRLPRNHARKAFCVLVYFQIGFEMCFFLGLAAWINQCPFIPYALGAWLICNGYFAATDHGEADGKSSVEDSLIVRVAKQVLGARFSPRYESDDDHAPMTVTKEGVRCLTLLPVALFILMLVSFSLEIDVVLVKIEMFESHYLAFTSSAVAAFAFPDIYLMVADSFDRFQFLKYGISLILVLEGLAFLLHRVIVFSAMDQIVFIMSVMLCSMFCSEVFDRCVRHDNLIDDISDAHDAHKEIRSES